MGIRIHKVLGYALTDIKATEDGQIIDPRFKLCSHEIWENVADFEVGEMHKWMKYDGKETCQKLCASGAINRDDFDYRQSCLDVKHVLNDIKRKKNNPVPRFIWENEVGLPNVMMFVPPGCPDWYRYDNTLDYYEANYNDVMEPKLLKLDGACGIYPYVGMVCFREPNEEIKKELTVMSVWQLDGMGEIKVGKRIEPSYYNQLIGKWDKETKPMVSGKILQHFLNDWRPVMPGSLLCYVKYLDIFVNAEEVINELRPAIYTYWS